MRRFLLIAAYLTLPFSIAACSNADEELRAAEAAFEEKMFDEAIAFWTQAMASELLTRQQSAETHARRGMAYALIGKCDDAAADAKWAVDSDLLSIRTIGAHALPSGAMPLRQRRLQESAAAVRERIEGQAKQCRRHGAEGRNPHVPSGVRKSL